MKAFNNYIKQYKFIYLFMIFLSGIGTICALIKAYSLSLVIDEIFKQQNSTLLRNIVILLVLILLLEQGISYVVGYLNTFVSQEIAYSLRKRLIKKLSNVKVEKLYLHASEKVIVNLTEDVNNITNILCNYLVTFLNAIFTALLTICVLLYLDVQLAIISFIVVLVRVFASIRFSKITKKNQRDILANNTIHIGIIKQLATHIKYFKAYRAENVMFQKYDNCSNRIVRLNFIAYLISYIINNFNAILDFLGSVIVFVLGVIAVYQGRITIGILFVFDSITNALGGSISSAVGIVIATARASVSINRVNQVFTEEEEINDGSPIEDNINNVAFSNISFSYDGSTVLDSFSYKFEKGNIYAVMGKSGIGKSTLANLFLKFYNVSSGNILINGLDIHSISSTSIRSKITLVFQEGVLLDNATIKENITFGNDISDEKLYSIVKACHINEFVDKYKDGLETILTENGSTLSGGEKQRIYIARALLRDSDVYIFDEAFSGMDSALSNDILFYIENLLKDKIVIIISHDLSIICKYNNIIFFEEDRRISCGDHKTLERQSEQYRKGVSNHSTQLFA